MRDFENVGLVDAGQFLAALGCELKRDASHASNFLAGVAHGVPGFAGCLVPLARLAEVEAAEQFAHEKNVGAVDDLRAQRRVDGEFLEGEGGAQVGVAAQRGAQLQQAGFGALVGRKGIELVAADGAEENRVGVECRGQGVGGERGAVVDDGGAADALVVECERVAAQLRDFIEDGDGFVGDFRADAVAGGD